MLDDLRDLGAGAKNAADKASAAASAASNLQSTVLSPIDQQRQALETAKMQAEAPIQLLQQKGQQLSMLSDAAQKKADAVSKLQEMRTMGAQRSKNDSVGTISDQKSVANKAGNSVQDRMNDVKARGDALKSILEQIEAQAVRR